MTFSSILPQLYVRDTSKPKSRRSGTPVVRANTKYDHFQMLQDRAAGMKWADIAVKHGIPGEQRVASRQARALCLNSAAAKNLKPHEIEKIHKQKRFVE